MRLWGVIQMEPTVFVLFYPLKKNERSETNIYSKMSRFTKAGWWVYKHYISLVAC